MLRKLRRWVTLAPADRTAVVEAWLLLLVARLSLRWLSLERSRRLVAAILPFGRREAEPLANLAARLRRWIDIAAANQPRSAGCLERSLVLHAMLSRRGHEAELRIGVRRLGAELEAHAWVECGGNPVADTEHAAGGYSSLLPAAGGR